ncbi:MAG: histidine--tRNA ligase [Candidatus Nealsonbacteria bacterium]
MAKKSKIQKATGMRDILPGEQRYFQKVFQAAENIADFYNFKKLDIPILENSDLYLKGTGSGTDIVQKQSYTLRTKGGDSLTLRPEFTPGVIRAYIEHGMHTLPQPVKFYSLGPLFRYEHPQAGRYRQFNQFNIEVIGEESPVVDAQVIQIFYNILTELKIKNLIVEINSIGDSQCRPYYKKLLVNYFKSRDSALCADCRRRLKENPLRVLDCKEEKCQRIISQAPQTIDHLCDECHSHFKNVLEFLDETEIPYRLNPHLVRGLDYYTKTVFEMFIEEPNKKEGEGYTQKIALAAGGRYDGLVKTLGGEPTRATGGAMGIERVISLLKIRDGKVQKSVPSVVFLAQLGNAAKKKSLKLFEDFRVAKIRVAETLGKDSLKAQLTMADKLGVKYTLLLGQKEVLEGTIIIRDMKTGRQDTVRFEKVIGEIKRRAQK